MRGLVRTTRLWPGLAELWLRGSVWGLSTALAFALASQFRPIGDLCSRASLARFRRGWGLWASGSGLGFRAKFLDCGSALGTANGHPVEGLRPETIDPEQKPDFRPLNTNTCEVTGSRRKRCLQQAGRKSAGLRSDAAARVGRAAIGTSERCSPHARKPRTTTDGYPLAAGD